MAFIKTLPSLALFLVLLPVITLGDDPLTPLYDAICDKVECGKGKCKANITYKLGYICECENGWTRTRDDDINNDLQFLPCVIPNCTLDYGCQPAPPPAPEKPVPLNTSFFDPCYWVYCGEGSCTKNSTYTHLCTCKSGYSNLLDTPFFPCYSECTLGSDCSTLGIKVSKSTSTTNDTAGISENHGSSIFPGKLQLMIILIMSMLVVLRK